MSDPAGPPARLVKPMLSYRPSSRLIGLVHADVHRLGSPPAGLVDRRLHQGPADSQPALLGHHVQLGEVAFASSTPDRLPQTQHRDPERILAGEQDDRVTLPASSRRRCGENLGWRRGLGELAVEGVQQATRRRHVRVGRGAHRTSARGGMQPNATRPQTSGPGGPSELRSSPENRAPLPAGPSARSPTTSGEDAEPGRTSYGGRGTRGPALAVPDHLPVPTVWVPALVHRRIRGSR